MEMKNLNSVLKDVLKSIDYLNVAFTSDQIWDGKLCCFSGSAFLDFGWI